MPFYSLDKWSVRGKEPRHVGSQQDACIKLNPARCLHIEGRPSQFTIALPGEGLAKMTVCGLQCSVPNCDLDFSPIHERIVGMRSQTWVLLSGIIMPTREPKWGRDLIDLAIIFCKQQIPFFYYIVLKVGEYVTIEWRILEPKGNKLQNPSKWFDTHNMHLVAGSWQFFMFLIFKVLNCCPLHAFETLL